MCCFKRSNERRRVGKRTCALAHGCRIGGNALELQKAAFAMTLQRFVFIFLGLLFLLIAASALYFQFIAWPAYPR